MKFNFMKINGNYFRHRQIERKDGRTFMRMKQRGVVVVRQT
ncbi:MAG: hypothetical protein R6U32_03785 [Candidatus Woesearchaeota archaeon]